MAAISKVSLNHDIIPCGNEWGKTTSLTPLQGTSVSVIGSEISHDSPPPGCVALKLPTRIDRADNIELTFLHFGPDGVTGRRFCLPSGYQQVEQRRAEWSIWLSLLLTYCEGVRKESSIIYLYRSERCSCMDSRIRNNPYEAHKLPESWGFLASLIL